jgi:hypothetical protein
LICKRNCHLGEEAKKKRKEGKKEYSEILFEVAHHVFEIVRFLADFSSKRRVPVQSPFDAMVYYPTLGKERRGRLKMENCDGKMKGWGRVGSTS